MISRTKWASPLQLPKSLIHEGLGRFAAPSSVALATNTPCTNAHNCFLSYRKDTFTHQRNKVFPIR